MYRNLFIIYPTPVLKFSYHCNLLLLLQAIQLQDCLVLHTRILRTINIFLYKLEKSNYYWIHIFVMYVKKIVNCMSYTWLEFYLLELFIHINHFVVAANPNSIPT